MRARNGLSHSCACGRVTGVVGLLGSAGRVGFVVVVVVARRPGSPLVAVFVGVRLTSRGIPGNALLSKIYILACSEPSLQRVSSEKGAQLARSEHPPPSYVTASSRASCIVLSNIEAGGREGGLGGKGATHPATDPGDPPGDPPGGGPGLPRALLPRRPLTPIGTCRAYGRVYSLTCRPAVPLEYVTVCVLRVLFTLMPTIGRSVQRWAPTS